MAATGDQFLPRDWGPEFYRVIQARRGQEPILGTEYHGVNHALPVRRKRKPLLTAPAIPDFEDPLRTRCCQRFAIAAKDNIPDVAGMPFHCLQEQSGFGLPNFGRSISP